MKNLQRLTIIVIIALLGAFIWCAYTLFTVNFGLGASDAANTAVEYIYVIPPLTALILLLSIFANKKAGKSAKVYVALLLIIPIMIATGYFAVDSAWPSEDDEEIETIDEGSYVPDGLEDYIAD